jgi:hypothetical protein
MVFYFFLPSVHVFSFPSVYFLVASYCIY